MKLTRAIEPWLVAPLERFIGEAHARLVLIMTPAGQVLAQHGFTHAMDVMAAAALGAAIASSTGELVKIMGEPAFKVLNHQGLDHGIFLGDFEMTRGRFLALVVYGTESSVGLVQLFFEDLAHELQAACPDVEPRGPVLSENFERDLHDSLDSLFGR